VVNDAKIAKQLGINTNNAGDVYVLKEARTPFNPAEGNIAIADFPFTSERLLTNKELRTD
jgi:hypothetical protein